MNGEYSREEVSLAFEHFVSEAQILVDKYMNKNFPTLPNYNLEVREGSVYWKIVKTCGDSNTVFGFVRKKDGAIFKAASWRAPYTKGKSAIRGYVTDELAKDTITPYGIIYAM